MNRRYDPGKHRRRSTRLRGFDYARPGAYLVTLCTENRACLFGDMVKSEMRLNVVGQVVETCWRDIPNHFPHARLDAYVIMPNHIHGIIWIDNVETKNVGAESKSNVGTESKSNVGAKNFSPQPSAFRSPEKTLGSIVRGFKIGVTKWVRTNTDIYVVWQRNYYDHIIRNEAALNQIRQYIAENPARWTKDSENPVRQFHEQAGLTPSTTRRR